NQGKQSTTIERTNKKAREDVSATSNAKAGTIPAKTGIIPAKTGAAPAKSGTAPTKEGRRVPPWKLKAREGLIKGRWKDVTRVSSSQKKQRGTFQKRTTEVPKEGKSAPQKESISKLTLAVPASVKDVSKVLGVKANDIISKLLINHNVCATINQTLDNELIEMLGLEHDVEVILVQAKDIEEEVLFEDHDDGPDDLKPRAPIVTFLGHVDHGKTSLLDNIRKSNVVSIEAGGITQHIGAYRVDAGGKSVVFLDTPGHEAFTSMRARGANVTDIVVLVVAADDGVMPQTEEAINHARAAEVPIVVAINKVDKPDANVLKVKQQLSALDLMPEDWGGKIQMIETSVVTKKGLDDLLEGLLLEAEVLDLKASQNRLARGVVLEAQIHEGRGVIANLLVLAGVIKQGNIILCGQAYGRVRALYNDLGREIREAGPASPVVVSGLSDCPEAGDKFYIVKDIQNAREIALKRQRKMREISLTGRQHVTLDNLYKKIEEGQIKEIKIILKADYKGSVEVLKKSLEELSTKEVRVRILHSGVGGITETDVLLADASDAIVIGFHVVPEDKASISADESGVDVRLYKIIYDAINDIESAMEGMLEPEKIEQTTGKVEIRRIFKVSKLGNIAGCYVKSGKITRNSFVRLIRDSVVLYDGTLSTLRVVKDDAKEVKAGYECGVKINGYNDIKLGDVIESYEVHQVARKLK
ncbi:MAG: translation initiation factor IF-2, partial [Planctomycetes bacterium]|nr:translation initiation factor IF-2 [Planctomycetota bacterium]